MADERGAVIVYPEKRYIGDADLQALLAAHGVTVSLEEIKRKAGRVWNVVPSGNNWREALDHYGITHPVAAIKNPAADGIETSGFPRPFRFRVRRMVRRLFIRA